MVHSAPGATPVNASLFGWVENAAGGRATGRISLSAGGHYELNIPADTVRVQVFRGIDGYQPCAASVTPSGDVTADVHIFTDPNQLGGHLAPEFQAQGMTLSGVVYEQTTDGRRPVSGVSVSLDSLTGLGLLTADTVTDADGRYILCNVPQLPTLELDAVATAFDSTAVYGADLLGKTSIDIELRRIGR